MSYEQATKHTTFKTSTRHVLGEILLVLVIEFFILLIGLIIASICASVARTAVPDFPNIILLSLVVETGTIFFIFVPFAWLFAKYRLKFTLRIGQDRIMYGKWPFRETIHCMDVEAIYEKCGKVDNPKSYYVIITGFGKSWSCYFEKNTLDCIKALRAVCPNAIFIDMYGKEHFPQTAASFPKVIHNLIRTRYARAIAAFIVAIPCLVWCLIIVWAVIYKLVNGSNLFRAVEGFHTGMLAILGLGTATLATGLYQFRQAFILSRSGQTHMPQSVEEFRFQKSMEDQQTLSR